MILGICSAPKAKARQQIQILLEHLPPEHRIHRHHPKHHQCVQGVRYLGPSEEVEEGVYRHAYLSGGKCSYVGSLYMVHRFEEEEGRKKDTSRQWIQPVGIEVMKGIPHPLIYV